MKAPRMRKISLTIFVCFLCFLTRSAFTQTNTYLIDPNPATVGEADGQLTVLIIRSVATNAEAFEVKTTTDQGYSNNGDYNDLDKTINFPSGVFALSASVLINDDTISEEDKTFGISVHRNGDPADVYVAKSTFTILDDDRPPQPVITNPKLSGTTFTLSVDSDVGFKYVLEYKNTLNDPIWNSARTNSGTGGTIVFTNTAVTGLSRFYRVRAQQ